MSSPSPDLVNALAVSLALSIATALVAIALQAVVQARRRRRNEAVLAHLARHAFDKGPAPVPGVLRRLSPPERAQLLAVLAGELAGRDLVTLAGLADRSGVTSLSVRWCRSRRWRRRLRGAQIRTALVAADPMTPRLLDDVHPMVRAEAARAAARHPSPALCTRLVSMLDDPSAACRFAATEALMGSGEDAVPAVIAALSDPDAFGPSANVRIQALLAVAAQRRDADLVEAVTSFTGHVVASLRAAAIATVGALHQPGSRELAAAMLDDIDPGVRVQAANALGMVATPIDAHLLVPGMSDPEWDVREASGLALHRLGAMGRTYLRWVARGGGPGAAMAHRVLELRIRDDVVTDDLRHTPPHPRAHGAVA
jgi:hypothetical protein